jgi:hypothetical protein
VKSILFATLLSLNLVGCGEKDSDNSTESNQPPIFSGPTFSLNGINETEWESACSIECDNKCSRKRHVRLEENTFRLDIFVYSGTECLEKVKRITYSKYYIGAKKEPKEKLAGWTSVSAITDKVLATVHQENVAMSFNKNANFGFRNWIVGEAKDVSGLKYDKEAEAEDSKGSVWERTFKIENDLLYFAKYKNNVPVNEISSSFKKQ